MSQGDELQAAGWPGWPPPGHWCTGNGMGLQVAHGVLRNCAAGSW